MATYCHSSQSPTWSVFSDNIRIQGPPKGPSLGPLHPVSTVKERYRKGGKCKISRVLQSPVSNTQASPKVEASYRLKQAQHFSTCRKILDGNSRVRQDLPDSRGMGIVDRSIGRLPSHPHPSSLKEIPRFCHRSQVFQFTSLPFTLATAPQVFTMIVKEVKLMALSRSQTPPIPGRLADQVAVGGGSPSEHSGSGRSNPDLGMDHQSMKSTESHSGVFRSWVTSSTWIQPL